MIRIIYTLFCVMTMVACGGGFTPQEREVIYGGEGEIMAVMSVENQADSILLRSKCEPVVQSMVGGDEFSTLCRRMLATVNDPEHEGVGIAAPQVGVLRRLVAVQRFDKEGEPFEFFLNPEIVEHRGEKELGGEGCLSIPDMRGDVARSQEIVLTYRDVEFKEHTEVVSGFTAVIFQHEIDHLDGVLYIDRMEK